MVLPEVWRSSPFFVLLWEFHSHKLLLLHRGFRALRAAAFILCIRSSQRQF
jgi:hypothetical protein